jgi:DNA helicase-2/ATP-dependent DNA helicase PcrA
MLDRCRAALRSPVRIVAVEAAAGCGKTHEAVSAAVDVAATLPPGREVLLLAHTHAAVNVFRKRVREKTARVRALTLDAFALELVSAYAPALGLPVPFRIDETDGSAFATLAPRLCELMDRAPSVARALANHYPVVIFDEHQDAREKQHEIALHFAKTGSCRVRLFGDPLQAIFDFDVSPIVPWQRVIQGADETHRLDIPRRWTDAPTLGDWLSQARQALSDARPLPLMTAPTEVVVDRVSAIPELHLASKQALPELARLLFRVVDRLDGTVAILVRNRAHTVGLHRALARRIPIHEGSDLSRAVKWLTMAVSAKGNAREMVLSALGLIRETGVGCTKAFLSQVERRLGQEVDLRRAQKILPFLEKVRHFYRSPSLSAWCEFLRQVLQDPPDGIHLDEPAAIRLLSGLRLQEGDDVLDAVARAIRVRREHQRVPRRCISTIHRAKGEEFDHVIVVHCNAGAFPGDLDSRKLMYVAISRARRSVRLVASASAASPLLG